LHSLGRIGEQDPHSAELVLRRVRRALALLLLHPGLGTPTHRADKRRFAIPNTGHAIEYRLVKDELRGDARCVYGRRRDT
jgi:plasmid stabilization system protein ParE